VRARAESGVALDHRLAGTEVVDAQHSYGPAPQFARKPSAVLRLDDVVGVVEVDRSHEIAAVLDEEWPHFGEIGWKALVGNCRIVNADLAEVRIDRGIQHQAIVQDELGVEPAIALQMLVFKVRIDGIDGVQLAQAARDGVRLKLHVLPAPHVAETLDFHILREASGDVVIAARPEVALVGVRHVALEDDAPGAHLTGLALGKVEAGEGNAH
jgi:hypothetical protein